MLQESNVLIIPERENESLDNPDNENGDEDAGYPQSPDSDVPESTFSNPNRVCYSIIKQSIGKVCKDVKIWKSV